MIERFEIAPGLEALLKVNGLVGLEPVFRWSRGQRLDKKNLEAWRQRWCLTIADNQNRETVFYLKRFERPPLARQFQRWRTGQFWRSSASVEWSNSRELKNAGIPAARPAAFGERMCGPVEIRSFILLQQVKGDSLERICASPERAGSMMQRRNLFNALTDLISKFHRQGFVHRDLYLSHIFLDFASPSQPFSLIDLQRVFKPRWRARRWVVKDLAALHFSTPAEWASLWTRLRFLCRYVRACDRFGSARQLAALIERKTRRMRRRTIEKHNSVGTNVIRAHSPRHAGG